MSDLFPPSFVEGLHRLRLIARRVPHGRDAGEHASRFGGSGTDFRDFRPYAPGDDLRRVDWNAYRRSQRLLTRLFEEPRRVSLHVVLDISESMFFEQPPRANAGRQVAAAFAAVALEHHDGATIYPYGSQLMPPIRSRGARELPSVLASLKGLTAAGVTRTAGALQQFAALKPRSGVLVLISDFFDPAGLESTFEELNRQRHRIIIVRLSRRIDANPELMGDVELVDCENASGVRVAMTRPALEAYAARYTAFDRELRHFASRRNAPLLTVDADERVLPQLESVFVNGTLRL